MTVENPKPLAVASKRLRQVDKALARSRNIHGKTNHSNRRERLYAKRRRLHARVVNIRNDHTSQGDDDDSQVGGPGGR